MTSIPLNPFAGTPGDDFTLGTAFNDNIAGQAGNDSLDGADGNDTLDGGEGNDTLWGGLGHDTLIGGKGADLLCGGDGDDQFYAGSGHDTLIGGDGNDTLNGGGGNDQLQGDAGNDQLQGHASASNGAEVDRLWGGAGCDLFNLAGGYLGGGSRDYAVIGDFRPAEGDRLQLSRGQTYTFRQSGGSTTISCGSDAIALLNGVGLGSGVITTQGWVTWA